MFLPPLYYFILPVFAGAGSWTADSLDGALSSVKIATRASRSNVPSLTGTSFTLLYQNDLSPSNVSEHISALLTGELSNHDGGQACAAIHESPMPKDNLLAYESDVVAQFNYLCYSGALSCPTSVWIEDGALKVEENMATLEFQSATDFATASELSLPQLCTQSSTGNTDADSAPSSMNQVTVQGNNGNSWQGYRNRKAWRFLGVPFSNTPTRFEYSSVYDGKDTAFTANVYGPECPQGIPGDQSEDCLFLNIHSPYLPGSDTNSKLLRPVLFYIHGGAFMAGDGGAASLDGDNMASREDVVMVSIAYRLNTYGFLAIPNTDMNGNYGVSDMVSALDWVKANIEYFGGDPNQITIAGQSAGAAGVRMLLGSDKAIGKYQRAIVMSNLGGGVDLGDNGDYGTTNSEYLTIDQSFALAGSYVLEAAGCTQSTLSAQVSCIKSYKGNLATIGTIANYPVQDGTYVTAPHLLAGNRYLIANVPVLMGNMANDGASFIGYDLTCTTPASCIASNLNIPLSAAQAAYESGLWPYYNTGNFQADMFNISAQIRTDDTFRCIDQATAYAGFLSGSMGPVYYYQVLRSYGGYSSASDIDGYGPVEPNYPYGDPGLPYYRLHTGELGFALGNQAVFRDAQDWYFTQLMTAYWGSFVRTGNPNPAAGYLEARRYSTVQQGVQMSGTWQPVNGNNGPMMELGWPSFTQASFNMEGQCGFLNYTLNYYL